MPETQRTDEADEAEQKDDVETVGDFVERCRQLLDDFERDLDRVDDAGRRFQVLRDVIDDSRAELERIDELEGQERKDAALELGLELGEEREKLQELEEAEQ